MKLVNKNIFKTVNVENNLYLVSKKRLRSDVRVKFKIKSDLESSHNFLSQKVIVQFKPVRYCKITVDIQRKGCFVTTGFEKHPQKHVPGVGIVVEWLDQSFSAGGG